jgi:hypothetical protein
MSILPTLVKQTLIRELEQSVRLLSDQVKFLTMNTAQSSHQVSRASPVPSSSSQHTQGNLSQLLRQPHMPPAPQQPTNYAPSHVPFPPQPQQAPPMHSSWFTSNIAAPQASHPTAPPPVPAQPTNMSNLNRTPPLLPQQSEEWDDTYLAVLGSQDTRQLRELLGRSNPDAIMPLQGGGPLSQAVVLTLVHRVSCAIIVFGTFSDVTLYLALSHGRRDSSFG